MTLFVKNDKQAIKNYRSVSLYPICRKFIKNDKQSTKNYRSVSLYPICGKVLERLLYKEIFSFFIENDLIFQNQSGLKPGDSYINQLLSITHDIYKSFDDGWEVRGALLNL